MKGNEMWNPSQRRRDTYELCIRTSHEFRKFYLEYERFIQCEQMSVLAARQTTELCRLANEAIDKLTELACEIAEPSEDVVEST